MLTSYEIYSMCKSDTGLQNGKNKTWRKKKHKIWNKFILWCLTMSVNDKINILSPFFLSYRLFQKKNIENEWWFISLVFEVVAARKNRFDDKALNFIWLFHPLKLTMSEILNLKKVSNWVFISTKMKSQKSTAPKWHNRFILNIILCAVWHESSSVAHSLLPANLYPFVLVVLFWMIRAQI